VPPRALAPTLALALAAPLSGCATVGYVAQAAQGQLELATTARSIDHVVADPDTPPRTAALLREIAPIKAYGERHGLTPTTSYRTYVELDRPAVVWVVNAAAPLSFESRWWTFPFVGRINYLGWFDRGDAEEHADRLRAAGWDADVRGASAYSTLGWFSDPVLSSMIPDGDDALGELASTVLHESVHATVYLPGATELNESLAEVVGNRLAWGYLVERGGPGSREARAFVEDRRSSEARSRALTRAREKLEKVYASAMSPARKRIEKELVIAALEAEIGAKRRLNNATLVQAKTYDGSAEAIEALVVACGGDVPRLMRVVGAWAKTAKATTPDARAAVEGLTRAGCPEPAAR
jgi:predicted aminopeptidase